MLARWFIGMVVLVGMTGGACTRDSSGNVRPSPATDNAGERAGAAASDLGHAVVRGAEGAGNGIVCGTRELGQTMSGTQGVPEAEARSREACDKAQQRANQAGQSMDQVTHDLGQNAHGGGPTR